MPAEKVYVINQALTNESARRPSPERRAASKPSTTIGGRPQPSRLAAVRGYFLGPVSLILWPRGRGRIPWLIVAAASLAAMTLLLMQWHGLKSALSSMHHGAVTWAMIVTVAILLITTTWCRAIVIQRRGAKWPQWVRSAGIVGLLGMLAPGLGLLIAGRRWRAAIACCCVGIVAVGMTILVNWRWLATHYQDVAPISNPVDNIIIIAIVLLVIGAVAWIVQALDGVRIASPAQSTVTIANGLALGLVLVVIGGLASFQPRVVAAELSTVAAPLRAHGLHKLSLRLYEAASFFDPVTPGYLVAAKSSGEELGMVELAAAKQSLLQSRATELADVLGAQLVTRPIDEVQASPIDPGFANDPWNDRTSPIRE